MMSIQLFLFVTLFVITSALVEGRQLQEYFVRSFLCDEDFNEIKNPEPVERDDGEIIVCFQTDKETELQGVGLMKVNTFQFYKEADGEQTVTQKAVDAGAESFGTILDCPGGESYCSFRTELRDNFFYTDGTVQGIGSVALESINRTRRALRANREMQEFVGLAAVNLYFDVEDGLNKKKIEEARKSFKEHWNEQPPEVQALYISGILVLLLLICCFCAGLILWPHCCADTPGQWVRRMRQGDEIHVMPPADMDGKKDEDNEETHSLDDSDVVPEEDEEEESSDEEEQRQRQQPAYNSRQLEDEKPTQPQPELRTRSGRPSFRASAKGNELVPYKSPSQRKR